MATFAPEVPDTDPKSFLGYSRGIGTDKRFGTLFEGSASLLDAGVKGADEVIQRDIRKEATASVDKVRTLFGVDAAEQRVSDLPPEVVAGRRKIQQLNTAYKSGTIRGSYYYGHLQDTVKSLRAKFPGYDEQIDNIIQDITGVTPANAIVSSLRQEALADKAEADANARAWQRFVDTNSGIIGIVAPGYIDGSKNYSQTNIRSKVSGFKAQAMQMEFENDALALELRRGEVDDVRVGDVGQKQAVSTVNRIVESTLTAASPDGTDEGLFKRISELAGSGEAIPVEEMTQLRSQTAEIMVKASTAVDAVLNKPINEAGDTMSMLLPIERIEEIKKQALFPLQALQDSLTDENFGLFNINAATVKAQIETGERELFGDKTMMRSIILDKRLPNMFSAAFFDPLTLSATQAAVANYLTVSDKPLGPALSDVVQSSVKEEAVSVKKALDTLTQAGEGTNAAENEYAAEKLFHPDNMDFLEQFRRSERIDVFNQLVSPKMSKRMKDLGGDTWQNYKKWGLTNFNSLFREAVANTQKAIKHRKWLDISWDSNRGQFIVADNTPQTTDRGLISDGLEGQLTDSAKKQINVMNRALSSIKPIVEDEGDFGTQMTIFIEAMGLDPEVEKEGPLLDMLTEAIAGTINTALGGSEEPDKPDKD